MLPSSGVKNPYLESWFSLSLKHPTLFTALLYSSLTHKRIRHMLSSASGELFDAQDARFLGVCSAHATQLLNEALRDPDEAVSDVNILSVLMMIEQPFLQPDRDWEKQSPFQTPLTHLQWLVVHGAREPNLANQNGLTTLVNLKGGLQNIKIPGVAPAIF